MAQNTLKSLFCYVQTSKLYNFLTKNELSLHIIEATTSLPQGPLNSFRNPRVDSNLAASLFYSLPQHLEVIYRRRVY